MVPFCPKHAISFQSSICDLFKLVPESINYKPSIYAPILAIKPSINSIKPSIKFNWVHKHLILDFSSSNWIFFVNRALINQKYTIKFQTLYFLTSLTNFWLFYGRSDILFSLQSFLDFLWIYFFLYFLFFFCVGTQKWVTIDAPSLQHLRSKDFAF
jgi:hypothetical protein